ncbi:MAG: phage major capsid protein [Acetobacteraceae bacterium]|nr:phage major capsid protein [Acetobacteraceae bacterium]
MKRHEIKARRDAIQAELRQLDPTAENAETRMAELETELGTLATRAKHLDMLDQLDATNDATPAERRDSLADATMLAPEQRMAAWAEARGGQSSEGLSFGRYVAGSLTGRWQGAERERELRTMASTSGATGGFLVPEPLSNVLIDLVRNRAVFVQAGARTIPMASSSQRVPMVASDPTAYLRGEGQEITESDASFAAYNLHAYSIAALLRFNNELAEDAPGFDAMLTSALSSTLALKLDALSLYGTGASQPIGLRNLTGAAEETMGGNGAALTNYDPFLTLMQTIEEANGMATVAIMAPRTRTKLAKLVTGISGDLTKLTPPADFTALRRLVSNQVSITETQGSSGVASTAFMGDFTQCAVALRQGITIEMSRVADDAFSKNQTLIRAIMRADIAWFRPAHVGRLIGVL